MKKFLTMLSIAALIVSCSYDDQDLWDKVNDLDSRIAKLETAAKKTNADITALQQLVTALQGELTISSVDKTSDGYLITFSNGETATITNGSNGTNAPVISIRMDTDGHYYWTSDGAWLLVDGNKIKAEGVDGDDAIVPEIRINADTEEWEISTDGGTTWLPMGPATSDSTGDSLFKSATVGESSVTIVLSDDTILEIPLLSGFSFVIEGNHAEVLPVMYGKTTTLQVEAKGVADYTITKPYGWKVSYAESLLSITAPKSDAVVAELEGEIAIIVVGETGASMIAKLKVEAVNYELRVLTFEDEDYLGGDNTSYWSMLIDSPQYNGPLLYGDFTNVDYNFNDENNTFIASEFPLNWGSKVFWGGGHAVSNYMEQVLSNGDFNHQLAVYYKHPKTGYGGHNGSKNFCVHFGYRDNSGLSPENLPFFYFADGAARVVDHMYVTSTTYLINAVTNGNGLTEPVGKDGYVRIIAIGYDADGNEIAGITPQFELANDKGVVSEWMKWDLSSLGEVSMIEFNMVGSSDNGFGFSQPAYFAYDDVAVRFE